MLINPIIAGLTFRQTLARRRWIIVVGLALVPVLVSLVTRIYTNTDELPIETVANVFPALILSFVVPLMALLLASSAFGAEVDDGTVIYLLTKPVPRSEIVVTKLLMTSLTCAVLSVASTLASGVIALKTFDDTRLVIGFAVAAALGSLLYCAIFLALGLVTRRGLLIGLTYLVVWEGALSQLFAGTRTLSVRQYMLSVADAISTVDPTVFTALLPQTRAYWMSGVVAVGAAVLCWYRLRNFEIGETG